MSKGKLGAITNKTLVPISAIAVIAFVIYWVVGYAAKVDAIVQKDSPSRPEFNQICSQLSDISKKIDTTNNNVLRLASRDKQ